MPTNVLTDEWISGSVSGSGSVSENRTGLPNRFRIVKIKITPSAGGGNYRLREYYADTHNGNVAFDTGSQAQNPFFDPADIDEDDNLTEQGVGRSRLYVDDDESGEYHYKIDNDAAGARTFTIKIWYLPEFSDEDGNLLVESVGPHAIYGLCYFPGDGTDVFELPADATDPTSGGGAATGRIPVKIGGVTKYLAYY